MKPEPIAADQISQTVDTEVLVIGGGYSGSCCALSAAQNGAKTILVEKDAVLNGHGVGGTGSIASRALDDLGLKFDKSLEMERWVSTCGNRCRESLVGKWFRESERCMNWFLDMAEANGANCMVTVAPTPRCTRRSPATTSCPAAPSSKSTPWPISSSTCSRPRP